MAEQPQDPFAAELAKREQEDADPFAAELRRRQDQERSVADTLLDWVGSGVRGFNYGLAEAAALPYRGARHLMQEGLSVPVPFTGIKGEVGPLKDAVPEAVAHYFEKPAEDLFPLNVYKAPRPETTGGRYIGKAGEVLGESAMPMLGMAGRARAVVPGAIAATPTTTAGAVVDAMVQPYATAPMRAAAADVAANVGAGVGQQAAEDMGFGPAGQTIGGMLGGVLPAAAHALYDFPAQTVRRARANASPHAKVAEGLGENLSIDDLASQIAVGTTRSNEALSARVFDTLGQEMVSANGNREVALRRTLQRLETEGGVQPATAREQLRRVMGSQADNELFLGEYPAVVASNDATRMRNPDTILDNLEAARTNVNRDAAEAARLANDPGRIEDSGTHWLLDTIANSGGGEGSTTIRNAINNRLAGLRDAALMRIQEWSPNGQTIADADAALERARRAGNAAYRAVYDAQGGAAVNYNMLHGMLARVVDRQLGRAARYSNDQADALRNAIDRVFMTRPAGVAARDALPALEDQLAAARAAVREARRQQQPRDVVNDLQRNAERIAEDLRLTRRDSTPAEQRYLMPTLEQLQNARSAIRAELDGWRQNRPDLVTVIEPFYRDLTRIMQRSSPQWRQANQQWADLRLDMVARDLGANFDMRAGRQFRDQLRDFNRLAPEAQNFVRIEFVQNLIDRIHNMGDGDTIAKIFKTPHVKEMVRTILGDEAAVDMMRVARDLNVAAKSKNMMGGSPTAPRLEREQKLNADVRMIAEADIPTSLDGFFDKLKKYTVGRLIDRRNAEMGRVLTTPVRDTARAAEHIERMRQARALAARYAQPRLGFREQGLGSLPGQVLEAYDDFKKP